MKEEHSPYKSVKEYIHIILKTTDGKSEAEHFDYNRNQEYKTNIDSGYENLNLHEDLAKIMLYMQNDIICFKNGRTYKVLKREFQPCVPVTLYLYVEEII